MKTYFKPIFYLLILITISCKPKNPTQDLIIDVQNVEIENKHVLRFEKDIFETPLEKIKDSIPKFRKKYGSFFNLFTKEIIFAGNPNDSALTFNLMRFASDKDMQTIYSEAKKKFSDFSEYEKSLNDAFKHYKHYFPKKITPTITTCVSGFNYQIITLDTILAISLDMYYGTDYKYYAMMGFPQYRVDRLKSAYIVPDCMRAWAMSEYTKNDTKNDLISDMIYQGKILYFADAMLPEMEDSLKMGYTRDEMEWCRENEANIWAFFIEKKLLYNNVYKEIKKYTSDGPFTATISKKSPSRIGVWIGWQIVRSYMNAHKDISLEQLMNDNDAHKILNLSKYKPKR